MVTTAKPKRIQRRRTKGWRIPPNSKYIGRGTLWGNPYRVKGPLVHPNERRAYSNLDAVAMYRWALRTGRLPYNEADIRANFKGVEYIVCWCKPNEACHGDVILKILEAG